MGFALGLQAARRFDKEDAVDFMLLIAETLSKVSHHINLNCWRYSKFAVSMEIHADDYRQFPIDGGENNYLFNLRVPLSVRGRLAFLAAAQADEMCQATYPQIVAKELVERSEQIAQEKCTILFRQSWCQFDSEHYMNF